MQITEPCRAAGEMADLMTPADVYYGRQYAVLTKRAKIKQLTMRKRKREYNDLFLFGVTLNWKKLPWSGRATF